jgi:hypothetical protein
LTLASLRRWLGLVVIVAGLGPAARVAAQERVLTGRALDAGNEPVAGLEVMLHRVTSEGGATVARDTTDPEGAFELSAASETDDPVYFVATRYEGEIQIGPMLRAPFPDSGYVLRVGGGASAAVDPTRPDPRKAIVIVGALAVLGLGMAYVVRPPARRRLLLRLAQIEEARAAGEPAAHAGERRRILTRLRRVAGP